MNGYIQKTPRSPKTSKKDQPLTHDRPASRNHRNRKHLAGRIPSTHIQVPRPSLAFHLPPSFLPSFPRSRPRTPILPDAPLPQRLLPAPLAINHLQLLHIDVISVADPARGSVCLWRILLPPTSQCILEAPLAEVGVAFADIDAVDVAGVADGTCEIGRGVAFLCVGGVGGAGWCCCC